MCCQKKKYWMRTIHTVCIKIVRNIFFLGSLLDFKQKILFKYLIWHEANVPLVTMCFSSKPLYQHILCTLYTKSHMFLRMIWLFSFSSVSSTNFLGNGAQIGVLIDACRKRLFFFMVTFIYFNMRRNFFFSHIFLEGTLQIVWISVGKKMRYFGFLSSKTVIQVFFFPKMRLYWDLCKKKDQKIPA